MSAAIVRDLEFMQRALELAQHAQQIAEVPVGAVLVLDRTVIGEGWNQPVSTCDPTAHAEIVALRAAGLRQRNYRFDTATMYVTLEPCAMCAGALINARVARVVFGAWDQKAGACGSVFDLTREPRLSHRLEVFGGVCLEQCSELLRRFFTARR